MLERHTQLIFAGRRGIHRLSSGPVGLLNEVHTMMDLIGQKYGRLTVLSEAESYVAPCGKKCRCWLCECTCDNKITVRHSNLRNGNSTSCGCWQKEVVAEQSRTHGAAPRGKMTPEYRAWQGLLSRCTNPNEPAYADYGGRGITVCPAWKESFAVFLADLGLRPSSKHSIDRIDNNGNYEPKNCRWATWKQQNRNTRNNRLLTFRGETLCVAGWAEKLGLHPNALYNRLRLGWSVERALSTPVMGV